MEKKRKFPRWIVIAVIAVLVCAGTLLAYDRLSVGEIDVSSSAPNEAMLLHIIEHAEELLTDERFTASMSEDGSIEHIKFTDTDALAYIQFIHTPREYAAFCRYSRRAEPDFFLLCTPWSPVDLYFTFGAPGILLVVNAYDAPAISDAPLREMMSAIESVIGTP